MNTSAQAAGGRHLAPANPNYPWRVVIFQEDALGWWRSSVFEMASFAEAEFEAMDICTEPYDRGVTAMHYVIGEVANG